MNRGGLETMLMNYYREINRNLLQFDFMVHRTEQGHYDEEIRSLGGNIYPMHQIRPGNYLKYFKQLDDFFIKHQGQYKIVHSHINENSSFVLRSAKRAGISCRIAHSHLSDLSIDLKLPFRWYARLMMRNQPNKFFACSQKAGKWLFGKRLMDSHQLTVLNNAVNVQQFKFDLEARLKIRNEMNAANKLVIGHVGRFNEQKNHNFMIDVFRAVHEKNPNTLLVLVGDGHLKSVIEKKTMKLGLSSHVKFFGVRSDITNLMLGMDLFLFPSLFEGLPVVMIEAQASGLQCIASDSITSEVDVTGRVEFVSLKQTSEAWAEKILKCSYEHMDTSKLLKRKGYDTTTMARWLTDYYMLQSKGVKS